MSWHGFKQNGPDWSESSKSLAVRYSANPETNDTDIYLLFNSDALGHSFSLPKLTMDKRWYRMLNTAFESPDDIVQPGFEKTLKTQRSYRLAPYSVVVLISK